MGRLTAKQQRFVEEYLVDLNATQAATRAGYASKTARQQGARLLSNVNIQLAVAEAQADRSRRTQITQDQVLEELGKIAFSSMRAYAEWGPDGVRLNPSDALTEDQDAAVAEASQTVTQHGGSLRIKLHDKVQALHLLGKHLGMFNNRSENLNIDLESLTDDQLNRIAHGESPLSVLANPG